ncbi:hypothetical protein KOR34_45030 [Posidoniimonas corsicana]|uniref:Uncharacterized protein n=1 Tax=Posidoniimonas corsicana TaxID=1938618 RepID=A0A5C5UY86_9BACT|nr:hypothetical protein [Posidoniimonas corsicana]TWT31128.1 hypothetical protein KOR34_45030 [Posidoniimonas corsicana]
MAAAQAIVEAGPRRAGRLTPPGDAAMKHRLLLALFSALLLGAPIGCENKEKVL